jgi:hypothetical protein
MKDWFKPIFTLFKTRLLRKLKFLIPMVDFAPQNIISQVKPMHDDEGCTLLRNVVVAVSHPASAVMTT